jgi:hypothetical protein
MAIKYFFIPALSIIFLNSCHNSPSKAEISSISALHEGLRSYNLSLNTQIEREIYALEDKALDPVSAIRGKEWLIKAQFIKVVSEKALYYIDSMYALAAKSNKTTEGLRSFQSKKIGMELYDRLEKYKNAIIGFDPKIDNEFGGNFNLLPKEIDSTQDKKEAFTKTYFDSDVPIASMAILTFFIDKVKAMEYRLIVFCNQQVGVLDGVSFYDSYSAIIGQSSQYVKQGEEIEVIAGVGMFSKASKPTIIINGENIALSEDGTARYKIKALGIPGKHSIPATINFTDLKGKRQVIRKDIEYTVIK